jgi:hypothetical protein
MIPDSIPVTDIGGSMAGETPKEKFLRHYPNGFSDLEYLRCERNYKLDAHQKWNEILNQSEFERLLDEEQYSEICRRAVQIEAKTNLLSLFEKSALRDAAKTEGKVKLVAVGLFDLIYGDDDFQLRFEEFALDLQKWPHRQTSPAKWTIATIFPFLAHPTQHFFLKPQITQAAAKRRKFSLNYRPDLNWSTYSCLLRFADMLASEVADLNPRDKIDIQSYLWVTEFQAAYA